MRIFEVVKSITKKPVTNYVYILPAFEKQSEYKKGIIN